MGETAILTGESQWREWYPVVAEFWPVADVDEHVEAMARLTEHEYTPFGRRADGPVSFAGGYATYSPWYGEFFWLVDLVTRPDRRGEGHGSALYADVESWARERGCETIVLASGTDRDRAHEFYEERGFERAEYWFEKELG